MADLVTTYTLTTPGGTITMNNGDLGDGTDKYWVHDVFGLDAPNVRAPVDKVPFGDGSIIHTFWKEGRTPRLEGVLIVESVAPWGESCQDALNALEDAFRIAVESIIQADGTLAWTPAGLGARSLTVRYPASPALEFHPISNFASRSWALSLVSEAADW